MVSSAFGDASFFFFFFSGPLACSAFAAIVVLIAYKPINPKMLGFNMLSHVGKRFEMNALRDLQECMAHFRNRISVWRTAGIQYVGAPNGRMRLWRTQMQRGNKFIICTGDLQETHLAA